jgi:hypothetical protein
MSVIVTERLPNWSLEQWSSIWGAGTLGVLEDIIGGRLKHLTSIKSRWDLFFYLPNPSGRTRHWGLLSL